MKRIKKCSTFLVVFILTTSGLGISSASASNCGGATALTATVDSVSATFRWNALTDVSHIDSINLFYRSGSGWQSWYNNASGLLAGGETSTATSFRITYDQADSVMIVNDVNYLDVYLRVDNGTEQCYTETLVGTFYGIPLSTPSSLSIGNITTSSASLAFQSDGLSASQKVDVTPTAGGSTIHVNNFSSGNTITGLTANTNYTVSLRSFANVGRVNSSAATITFQTSATPVATVDAEQIRQRLISVARDEVRNSIGNGDSISLTLFERADFDGVNKDNLDAINAAINLLPIESRRDLGEIARIVYRFITVDRISNGRSAYIANDLVSLGLVPTDYKNKSSLTRFLKGLPENSLNTLEKIRSAVAEFESSKANRKTLYQNKLEKIRQHISA